MTKANPDSLESKQFINVKVDRFRTKHKELEKALSSDPNLSDEEKEAQRIGAVKAMREETSTSEYKKHLRRVTEDWKAIMAFAKQKFWENPTKDQIDEIRTQFYWSEMDYDDIDSHTDLLENKIKLWQFIADKFWDSEKTLILLAQYHCRWYLEETFFDQSSLVQQRKKFFNEPLWSEYDNLTTPQSVRYHYWDTLQADVIIFKKFGLEDPSSRLNEWILKYFIDHADKWVLNKKMLRSIYGNFNHVDFDAISLDKFDEDAQKEIQKIRQEKEQEKEKERAIVEQAEKEEEERAIAEQAEKERYERTERRLKVAKVVTFPIRWPIVWVATPCIRIWEKVVKWSRKVVKKINYYNSPYAKRKRKEERREKREQRRQRRNNENEA